MASYLYFTDESSSAQVQKIVDIFEKGKIDFGTGIPTLGKLTKREKLEKIMNKIMRPSSGAGNYFPIPCPSTIRKSTLVRNAILKLEKPKVNYSICSFLFDVFTFYFFFLIGCCPF
jgi:hypothetical protein